MSLSQALNQFAQNLGRYRRILELHGVEDAVEVVVQHRRVAGKHDRVMQRSCLKCIYSFGSVKP